MGKVTRGPASRSSFFISAAYPLQLYFCIRKAIAEPDQKDQVGQQFLQYHPMGWIDVNNGTPLFTEEGFDTLDDAIDQVNFWTQELMFDVVYAFVDIFCDGNYDPVERVDLKSVPHVDDRPTWKEGQHWVPKV